MTPPRLPSAEELLRVISRSDRTTAQDLDDLIDFRNSVLEAAAEVADRFAETGEDVGRKIRKLKEEQ